MAVGSAGLGRLEIGFCISSIASVDSSVQIPTLRHSPNPEYILTAPFSHPTLKILIDSGSVPDAHKGKRFSVFKVSSTVSQRLFCFTPFVKFHSQLWHLECFSPVVESQKKILWRMAMSPVIKFYIPPSFHKLVKWIPPAGRGKVLEFPAEIRKSA